MAIIESIRQAYWFEVLPRRTILATVVAALLVSVTHPHPMALI